MNKYGTGKLSVKGVVCIPKAIRDILGAKPGDRLEFEQVGENVVVRAVKRISILDSFGVLKPTADITVEKAINQYREGL